MAEPVLVYIAGKLMDKLASFVVKEVSLVWGLKDELHKLQRSLVAITAVIADAENRQSQEQGLRIWLQDLKDVLCDIENVLDEFECEAIRKRVTEKGSFSRKVLRFLSSSNPVNFRFKMSHRIKEITKKLDEVTATKDAFNLSQQRSDGFSRNICRETHSYVRLTEVIGRDVDRDAILGQLLSKNSLRSPFVVSIVGMGGLGKTSLAKLVYNDDSVKTRFDTRIWVCVSYNFNLKQILQTIVNHLNPGSRDMLDVEQLQAILRDLLRRKKFLLVLDDVWNENSRMWNELRDLLADGNEGSSIIVTTRSSKVASIVGTCYEHNLKGLSDESCMALLVKPSDDGLVKIIDPKFLEIAGQIVEKCGGVPLVVKALGGLLSSNADVRYWSSIKDKDIFTVLQNEDDILPIIKLSYDHLPPHLKRCFHFCSLFPKDFQFDNVVLSRYWKSVGLINNIRSPEEVAELYMKELLARSFFQDFEDYGAIFTFKMHDLVHDLALSVTQGDYFTSNFDAPSNPCRIQHVSISCNVLDNCEVPISAPSLFRKANNYRTVMLRHIESRTSEKLLKACISSSKYLRLLDLEGSNFKVMPSSIGTLKHLRLLNLVNNHVLSSLPSSICNLQSLQALLLGGCVSLEELPRDMGKLINLEQLSVTTKQKSLKSTGIGYLKSLKFLWIFGCSNLESLFEGMDVEGLTALHGLSIRECTSLTSIPVNKLKLLTSLEVMNIVDCPKLDISTNEEPCPLTLRTLNIYGLPLTFTLPKWFTGSANTLESLTISRCGQLKELPEWLGNFKHLKRLEISYCSKLESLPDGLQSIASLDKLKIHNCDKLQERCQPNGSDWNKISQIPEVEIDFKRIK